MQKKIEITDAMIHRAMVELGWLFPETEEEVAWAKAQMKREGFNPELPDSLKGPPLHLLEKIRSHASKSKTLRRDLAGRRNRQTE